MKKLMSILALTATGGIILTQPVLANYGMMGCGPVGHGKAALLLIALAAGFWVLTLAEAAASQLKIVGRVVGWIILVVAAGGLICSAFFGMCRMKSCPTGMQWGCGMGMKMGMGMRPHPGMMGMMPDQSPEEVETPPKGK